MTPKGRRSHSLWHSCVNCHSVISTKDTQIHDSECSLPIAERGHSFIYDHILYGILELIKASDVPEKIASFKDELVLLSQSAMQLCGFSIGSNVLVSSSGIKEVRKVWPKSDGLLTSVHLPEPGFTNKDNKLVSSVKVTVSNLNSVPLPAKEVYIEIIEPKEILNVDMLLSILKFYLKGRIFFNNSLICVPFYGKRIFISVDKWIREMVEEISSLVDIMSLDEVPFLITESTKWFCQIKCQNNLKEPVKVTVKDIGGYSKIIEQLMNNIKFTLEDAYSDPNGRKNCYGILLYGCHGCGKSMLAQALINSSTITSIKIQGTVIGSQRLNDALQTIDDKFKEAAKKAPSVMLIDNLDLMTTCDENRSDKQLLTAALLSGFDLLENKAVVVIVTAISPNEINPSFRRSGRIESEIELGVPTAEERFDILRKYFPETELTNEIRELSKITHGYVGADLAGVWTHSKARCSKLGKNKIDASDLSWALSQTTPSGMRQALLQISQVGWDDIGGQEMLKLKLRQAVEWPLLYGDSFKRLAISPPKGVLMFGPPGCSKTMIAKALATQTSLNFISVKGSDIFSKWVGESEKSVRDIFSMARRVSPSILFLDEVDAIASIRENSPDKSSLVHDRVLSQLLTEVDGVQPLNNVIIIAATNRPDRIDKALLRPGRLDRLIYVPLPDLLTRRQIFEIHLNKTPTCDDVDIETLAFLTDGYSGAEVTAVCNEAALKALEENMDSPYVMMHHFTAALETVLPRTPKSLLEIYDVYINKSNN